MQKLLAFLEILSATLPTAVVNRPYTPDPLVVLGGGRCGTNNISARVVFGQMPEGLRLTPSGHFIGTPSRTGAYTFLVRASNDCEYTTRTFTLRVEGTPILVTTPDALEFRYKAGGPQPEPQIAWVSSNWDGMPYAVDADGGGWLNLRLLAGTTPPAGSALTGDRVTVTVDPGKLAPGTYRSVVKFTAWQTTNEPVIPVVLVVEK